MSALDLLDDVVWVGGPDEGLGVVVGFGKKERLSA
jgi:hypothetical protein